MPESSCARTNSSAVRVHYLSRWEGHPFDLDPVPPDLVNAVMPPGRADLHTVVSDMVRSVLWHGGIKLVSVHALERVPPGMIWNNPSVLDLEFVAHPVRYSAARRIATPRPSRSGSSIGKSGPSPYSRRMLSTVIQLPGRAPQRAGQSGARAGRRFTKSKHRAVYPATIE